MQKNLAALVLLGGALCSSHALAQGSPILNVSVACYTREDAKTLGSLLAITDDKKRAGEISKLKTAGKCASVVFYLDDYICAYGSDGLRAVPVYAYPPIFSFSEIELLFEDSLKAAKGSIPLPPKQIMYVLDISIK